MALVIKGLSDRAISKFKKSNDPTPG